MVYTDMINFQAVNDHALYKCSAGSSHELFLNSEPSGRYGGGRSDKYFPYFSLKAYVVDTH